MLLGWYLGDPRRGPGVVYTEARWKHWPCLFPQHGPGRKHLRKIELAEWQLEIVARYPQQLLRGLFHSDGCRFVNWASKPDGNILTDALDQLGIKWRQPRRNAIAVSRKGAVGALDVFVGPKS